MTSHKSHLWGPFLLYSVLRGRVESGNIDCCVISMLKDSSNILHYGTQMETFCPKGHTKLYNESHGYTYVGCFWFRSN